jgi:cytoskeletal protein CcmA (bactofilin family)
VWRKPEDNKPQAFPDAPASGTPAGPYSVSASPSAPANVAACVSQGIKIKGEIHGREDLFVDGTLQGKIHITEGTVTVGPNARVNAEIEASEIIVRGEVTGTLKAKERVQIWSSGKAIGDVQTRRIAIEDGAVLRGKVEIFQPKDEVRGSRPASTGAAAGAHGATVPAHVKE